MRRILIIALFSVVAGIALGGVDAAAAPCTVPNQLTNGQMADATQVMANFNALISCINNAVTPVEVPPQGRLTLTSNTPVMTADATGQTTIYYAPYQGNQLPVAGVMYPFSQLSYALSTSAHLSGNLYDIFAYNAAGSIALCTGPAWTSTTVRLAAISITNGIWSNTASLTCTISGGGSTASIAAGNSTYLGTFYATANGQTGMQFAPAGVNGGSNNMLGLWNAYNRVQVVTTMLDAGLWYSPTNTVAKFNNSATSRINYIDGLAQSNIYSSIIFSCKAPSGGWVLLYLNEDNTTAAQWYNNAVTTLASGGNVGVNMTFPALLGFHYLQAMTNSSGTTGSCLPAEGAITALLEM